MNTVIDLVKNKFSLDFFHLFLVPYKETSENHRLYLRLQLIQFLNKQFGDLMTPSLSETLTDLSLRPTTPFCQISLSHTKEYGLIAVVPKDYSIGVDLEELHRIKPALVKRVSSQKEPSESLPAEVWALKESAYKALNEHFPLKVLADVEVSDFCALDSVTHQSRNIYCKGQSLNNFFALTQKKDRFILGIVVFLP